MLNRNNTPPPWLVALTCLCVDCVASEALTAIGDWLNVFTIVEQVLSRCFK